jgi:GrpB-like predicted nucleotidyltransferase (UPF0157 family)
VFARNWYFVPMQSKSSLPPLVTHDGTTWSNAADDRVELVAFDPQWRRQYEEEASALASALLPLRGFRLEHFGSTAVPNIRAKPIIDIMLIHPMTAVWPELVGPITSLGYVHWTDNPRKDRMFFVKGMPPFGSRRSHHLHVRTPADAEAELKFRDLLRVNSALAHEYELMKVSLASRYPTDREAYTEGKTAFISRYLD